MDKSMYDVIADLRPLWERSRFKLISRDFGFSGDEVQRFAGLCPVARERVLRWR
jgi:hypothetical protein